MGLYFSISVSKIHIAQFCELLSSLMTYEKKIAAPHAVRQNLLQPDWLGHLGDSLAAKNELSHRLVFLSPEEALRGDPTSLQHEPISANTGKVMLLPHKEITAADLHGNLKTLWLQC